VRSLFRVAASAAVTALIVLPVVAATPAPAHAQAGAPVLAIDSISPQIATASSTVTVSGTITNKTGTALTGVAVELTSAQVTSRGQMQAFVAGNGQLPGPVQDGDPLEYPATIPPGGTASWRIQFTSADADMTQFGVYGLEAQLTDPAGSVLATTQSLLPFWQPGVAKLKIAWIWPLIDQPYTQPCGGLTSDNLESSLAPGGRLDNLLTAGTSDPGAQLTWSVDPALLGDAKTLSGQHEVGGSPDCTGEQPEPASTAAQSWLNALQGATAGQPVVATPYANVDVAALIHNGLQDDVKSAYQLGQEVADPILNRAFFIKIALPAGGLADQSVLTQLASPNEEHIPAVVLGSNQMPLADGGYIDNAISSLASGAGTTMSVLLADSTLTNLLKGAGTTSQAGQFAIEQQFLAQTAMIVAEAPNESRSLVVSPPETWDPTEALAVALLSETTKAPWLQPVQLDSLAGQHGRADQVARKALPGRSISSKELSPSYLGTVSGLDTDLAEYSSMLYNAPTAYKTQLAETLAATESSAWRGQGAPAAEGAALTNELSQYLTDKEHKVKIFPPGDISMAGASGLLPVTIQNGLQKQAVRVRLTATVATARGYANTLTITQQKLITVPPDQIRLVKLDVHSARQGSTTINLSLTSANGTVLPWTNDPPTKLTVDSTRYGQAILLLIAGAIGLLLLSSALRSGRRRLATATQGSGSDDGPDSGNVMTSAQDPTEAPDELADARRWADDT
jgi:hypothetical protein